MELLILVLLALSIVTGFLGKDSSLGFWGSFILSVFFTPVLPLFIILISEKKRTKTG